MGTDMSDDDFAVLTKRLKNMRAMQRMTLKRLGYGDGSMGKVFFDGKIAGITEVLILLCPDPMED